MKIDVLGCCVSRDTLELAKNEELCEVGHYVGLTSQIALTLQMLNGDENGCLPFDELKAMGTAYKSDSECRSISLTSQKKIFAYLKESSGDYLILDVTDCRLDILNYRGHQYVSFNNFLFNNKIQEKLEGATFIHPETVDEDTLESCLSLLSAEITKIYPVDRIIFYQYMPATEFVNSSGYFDKFGSEYRHIELFQNGFMQKIYLNLEKKLQGCHIVRAPENLYGDQNQKWGLYPFHFDELCYEYFLSSLKIILNKENDEYNKIEMLRQHYSLLLKIKRNSIEEKYRADQLESMLNSVICMNNRLVSDIGGDNYGDLKKYLFRGINDIGNYMRLLEKLKNDFLIIVSVKDTPGSRMPPDIEEILKNGLGFTEFCTDLWKSYVGVNSFGNVIFNQAGTGYDMVTYEHTDIGSKNGITLNVVSATYKKGNKSEIIINGTNYSCNSRGINIVIFDSVTRSVVDSVAFDSYCYQRFIRKQF